MPLFVGVTKGVVRETRTTAKGKKTWLFCKGKILDVRVSMNAIASALAHVLSLGSCPHKPQQTLKTLQKHTYEYKRNQPFPIFIQWPMSLPKYQLDSLTSAFGLR